MRLFYAVLFSEQIRQTLKEGIEQLRQISEKGSFTRPENLHLTLVFLGETQRVREAQEVLERVDCPPISLTVSGLGAFQRSGGEIYWAGIQHSSGLLSLQRQLQRAAIETGFSIEARSFRPHVTLGREVILPTPPALQIPPVSMMVERVSLMRSERTVGKLVYTEQAGKLLPV